VITNPTNERTQAFLASVLTEAAVN